MATIHLSTENLIRVAEAYALGRRWRAAMWSIGASEDLAYKWIAKSKHAQTDDDTTSEFYIEHRGVFDWWHNHCRRSRAEALIGYDAIVREQAAFGVEVPVIGPNGQLWRENPRMVGLDDEECDIVFGHHDRLMRDSAGNALPLTKIEQLPATTRNKILDQIPGYRDAPPQINIRNSVHLSAPLKALRRDPPRPSEQASLPAPQETEMVRDLRAKLKEAISNPNRASAKPDPALKPVEILGRSTGEMVNGRVYHDKPESVNTFPADPPPPPELKDHPRAYVADPAHTPAPPPNYARRLSTGGIDCGGMGRGPDPHKIGKSQGFKIS